MRSKSDFWLDLHRVAEDLEKEGTTDEERIASLTSVLDGLTPAAFGVYLETLARVVTSLNELLARCKTR